MGPEEFQAAAEEMESDRAWDNDKARDANYLYRRTRDGILEAEKSATAENLPMWQIYRKGNNYHLGVWPGENAEEAIQTMLDFPGYYISGVPVLNRVAVGYESADLFWAEMGEAR